MSRSDRAARRQGRLSVVQWRWTLGLGIAGAVLSMKRPHIEAVPLLLGVAVGAVSGLVLGSLLGLVAGDRPESS